MKMSEKCHSNNNSDNSLTSRRTDGGKNGPFLEEEQSLAALNFHK